MAIFEGTIHSSSLGMMTSVTISIPEKVRQGKNAKEVPVLYLLHGLSDNHSAWLRRTNIDYYAELANIAVVMPEVQRSFYTDMSYGLMYFTYISEELPMLCSNMFHISGLKEDNYIAGASMGGYGAMKVALRCPERFAAVGCFSGAVDIHARMLSDTPSISRNECIGINDCIIKPEEDLLYLTRQVDKKKCPKIYMSCGLSDFLYEDNKNFRDHLTECGISFIYDEWPGYHDWYFWEKSIQSALDFFLNKK